MTPRRPRAATGLPGRALLALAALGTTLAAAELVTRLVVGPPRYHSEPLELDPELGFRGIPGYQRRAVDPEGAPFAFALNAQGLRGREIPDHPAPEGVLRVAFVGDSFLVGEGLPEDVLLSSRVGAALAAEGRPNEVYNLAAPDFGTGQELLLLRRHAASLAPDLVVLAVYPHNDVINNFEGLAGRSRVSPGDWLRPYLAPSGGGWQVRYTQPLPSALRRHSRLYAVLEQRVLAFGAQRGVSWLQPTAPAATPAQRLAAGRAPRERMEVFRQHPPGEPWELAWQRTLELIAGFRDACAALPARLLVVVIPSLQQVQRTARSVELDLETRSIAGAPLDRWLDWDLPEARLADLFRREGIDGILLLPALRDAVRRGEQVYLPDLHLSARGHAIAAEAILRALGQAGPASPGPPSGQPVRLPRGGHAPRAILPGDPRHWRFRAGDWRPWVSNGRIEGAMPLPGALLAVPVADGELVVRGVSAARQPQDVELELVAGPRHAFHLERGPFELRVAIAPGRLPVSDGYVALRLRPSGAGEGAAREGRGPILREVGFSMPRWPGDR